jgi:antitoxin (DNA-binding transcriptional repressor) of toxin-antitoxin stability system
MKNQVVSATEFKARCLALLDEIDKKGGTIIVTKRGRAVATVGPAPKRRRKSLKGAWAGKIFIPDEVLMADYSGLYDCLRQEEAMSVDPSTASR